MKTKKKKQVLTRSLEDYLETIYEQVGTHKVARVKDIARARGVKAGSVSPAMRRLADLGLIRYLQREYIDLTPEGEEAARRVYSKHQILTRFLHEILEMPAEIAERDACAMEHSLSAEGMDHLTRFFEFLNVCSEGRQFMESFHTCPQVHDGEELCTRHTAAEREGLGVAGRSSIKNVSELKAGQSGKVTQISGRGAIRQRLLDMGILPNVKIEVERLAPTGDPIWIKLQGFQLSLRRNEAKMISVSVL